MNLEQHRRDVYSISRGFLFVILYIVLINMGVLSYLNLRNFVFWFNMGVLALTIIVIFTMDLLKYKIIEGKL